MKGFLIPCGSGVPEFQFAPRMSMFLLLVVCLINGFQSQWCIEFDQCIIQLLTSSSIFQLSLPMNPPFVRILTPCVHLPAALLTSSKVPYSREDELRSLHIVLNDVGGAAHCEFFVSFWLTHPHLCSRSSRSRKLLQSFGGKLFHNRAGFMACLQRQ